MLAWQISTWVGSQKKPPTSHQNTVFSLHLMTVFWGLQGAFFGDQPKWKISTAGWPMITAATNRHFHLMGVLQSLMWGTDDVRRISLFFSAKVSALPEALAPGVVMLLIIGRDCNHWWCGAPLQENVEHEPSLYVLPGPIANKSDCCFNATHFWWTVNPG